MLNKKLTILLAFQLAISIAGNAQNVNYFGWFPTLDLSGKIANRWSYNVYLFDAVKPYNSTENAQTDKARSFYVYGETGLSYQLTDNLSVTAAYVHERQNPFLDNYRTENRLFQQMTLKLPVGKSELKQRLRFDERFVQNRATGATPFTHRLRYLLGIKKPFADNKMYLMAYSEAFFNSSKSFKFDENWSALQLGFRLNDKNSIEAGLLFVGWINNAANDWLNQYYLQTTWVAQLDFPKK
ncbi:MAG: DUF2490 domain-containing protein [Saprospiraceae bacterium]|nr:DUF2490 domain-containing protein [Saprospiraceae bacterium]